MHVCSIGRNLNLERTFRDKLKKKNYNLEKPHHTLQKKMFIVDEISQRNALEFATFWECKSHIGFFFKFHFMLQHVVPNNDFFYSFTINL